MLENLESSLTTHGGKNVMTETISRKDVCAAWLAGIFEGEGCVYAYFKPQTNPDCRHRMTLTVGATMYNTHPLMIKAITEALVYFGVSFNLASSKRNNGDRPGIGVNIQGKGRAKKFFEIVFPYLASKRQQAELALKLILYRERLIKRNRGPKGIFKNMTLRDNESIKSLCQQIQDAKHNYSSVLKYSRKPNMIFGESSTTIRSPQIKLFEMI